jgi:hypothetical protein
MIFARRLSIEYTDFSGSPAARAAAGGPRCGGPKMSSSSFYVVSDTCCLGCTQEAGAPDLDDVRGGAPQARGSRVLLTPLSIFLPPSIRF